MPASNARALEKAKTIGADCYIFDLEDAVSPNEKDTAREQATRAASDRKAYGRSELVIRINGVSTPWFEDDVKSVCDGDGVDAILLPKTNSPDDVTRLREEIAKHTSETFSIWCMIETPVGVMNVSDIAQTHGVECLLMGLVDLANDLHCDPFATSRWNLQYALQSCVIAARAANVVAMDSVYIDIHNEDGFQRECEQGRDLGFDGKTVIHPKMVDVVHRVFSPSDDEIDRAKRIIDAHSKALSTGKGVATLDGKLVEELHVRGARRIISMAKSIASTQ